MSIAEFSAALQEQAYKKWFKNSSKSILNQTASELRKSEQAASKTAFTISKDTISEIVEYLSGEEATIEQVEQIKQKMLSFVGKRKTIDIAPNGELFFPRVSFDTISTILDKGFGDLIEKSGGKKISDIMEKGHVFGIATNLLKQTTINLSRSNVPEKAKTILIDALNKFEKQLEEDDRLTANIQDPEYRLYAKYAKNPRKYLVELQVKSKNQAAGLDARLLTNQLRRYFDPENFVALNKNLKKEPDDAFIRKLLNTPGSPTYIDILSSEISNTIKGIKKNQEYISSYTSVGSTKLTIDTKQIRKNIKEDLTKVRELKSQLIKAKAADRAAGLTSLAPLQTLLNSALAEQIAKNMGKRGALKYRTGRFASSAVVERLSVSREGMITAFYTYMKYPYQTFEPGFRQGSEARNPKTLISKSIREIAAGIVGNRLRAVRL